MRSLDRSIPDSGIYEITQRDKEGDFNKSRVWAERGNFYGDDASEDAFLVIGFDTEFKPLIKKASRDDIKAKLGKYEVLSYQVYCKLFDPGQPDAQEWGGVCYPDKDERLSLRELITFAVWKGISSKAVKAIPRRITLVGHFTRADVPALHDFDKLSFMIEGVRNTFVTLKPIPVEIPIERGPPVELEVALRDTMLLTAASAKSLKALGEILGVPKISLSDDPHKEQHLKENMDELLGSNPDLFERYALTDALICVRYMEEMIALCGELLGEPKVPSTLTGIGVKLLIKTWEEKQGLDRLTVIGREEIKDKIWDKKLNRYRTLKKEVPVAAAYLFTPLATESYHGGRNEQFWFGPAFEDAWTDYDLSGAYPTAMALIRTPDWDRTHFSDKVSDFTSTTLGVAQIEFEFPRSVRFPTIPVRTDNGLIFPRKGVSYCAAPEIELAKTLGAKLKIRHGAIVPYADDTRVFGEFIKDCTEKRNRYPSKTLRNLFWKELANSSYGKTAQGLQERRVFSLKDRQTKPLPPSQITNPFMAAYITSFVRAVLGEIMNRLPSGVCVFSCTTDGFLSNATPDEMTDATAGPMCRLFGQSREWLTGNFQVEEIKHQCRRPLGWRTRGQATLLEGASDKGDDYNIVLAKGGIHAPPTHDTVRAQNEFILAKFFNRSPEDSIEITSFTGLRDIVLEDADLVEKLLTRRLNMEFDWKRRPLAARETPFRNHHHLAFSTEPWNTVTEFETVRRHFEDLQGSAPSCMTTLADFERFAKYVQTRTALDDPTYLRRNDPDIQRLRLMLCSAWQHSAAGFNRKAEKLSAAGFAAVLTEAGVRCTRANVENGSKNPFTPHRCPPTAAVAEVLKKLKKRFKALDTKALLASANDQIDMTKALKAKCSFADRL